MNLCVICGNISWERGWGKGEHRFRRVDLSGGRSLTRKVIEMTSSFDAAEMFSWIERMAGMGPRRPGSTADRKNEDFLVEQLRAGGVEAVRKEPIPITYWEAHNSVLELDEGDGFRPTNAHYIPYAAFTPERGIEAPLVYADPKRLIQGGDWKGKVVVTDIAFPPLDLSLLLKVSLGSYDPDGSLPEVKHPATWVRLNWHLYRKASERGAAGFIGILSDQPGGSCRMFAPYGFKEQDIMDKPLPGFWVSRDDGPRLRDLAESGAGRSRMTLTGVREEGITHNVVGEIPGRTDEIVVLSGHHDSPFDSPVEDASGCSVVLALAKHFAGRQPELNRRLVILFSAGHFYGSIGTRLFIKDHREDIVQKTVLEISIEHIAKEAVEGQNGQLVPSGRPEATGIFLPMNRAMADAVLESVEAHGVDRVLLLPPEGPLGEYPPTDGGDWYEAGVPVINYISNPVYLLNAEDSLEWVARDRLAKVAAAFADIICKVDVMPRETIGSVESRSYQLKMKLLKHLVRAKTTRFGTRPVY